jgi:hypothetical protein
MPWLARPSLNAALDRRAPVDSGELVLASGGERIAQIPALGTFLHGKAWRFYPYTNCVSVSVCLAKPGYACFPAE